MEEMETSQDVIDRRRSPTAGLGLRCGAFLIDYIIIALALTVSLTLAAWIKRSWMAPSAANMVITMGYLVAGGLVFYNWVYLYAHGGRSLGKNFIGLRVIRTDGASLDYRTAALRHIIGYPISLLGLGILWMLVDSKQQGWHDKLAGTIVIRD